MSMFMGSFRLSRERGESTAHPGLLSRSLSLSDSHLKISPSKDTCAQRPWASRETHRTWEKDMIRTVFSQD